MAHQSKKQGFFKRLFNIKNENEKENHESDRRPNVRFANESRYSHGRHNQSYSNEEDLLDANGRLKPTAPYHTSTQTRASRAPRSCPGGPTSPDATLAYTATTDSEDDGRNNSFQSEFITGGSRLSRRSGKKTKRRYNRGDYTADGASSVLRPIHASRDDRYMGNYEIAEDRSMRLNEKSRYKELKHKLDEERRAHRDAQRKIEKQQLKIAELHMEIRNLQGRNYPLPPPAFQPNLFTPSGLNNTSSMIFSRPPFIPQMNPILQNTFSEQNRSSGVETEAEIKNFNSDTAGEHLLSDNSVFDTEIPRSVNDEELTSNRVPLTPPKFIAVEDEPEGSDLGYSTNSTATERPFVVKCAIPRKIRRTSNSF
ncbi:hypothetical protein M3Y98_00926100 [Aphelenchoides besseyi]|nr:hypothetical protein M3Y98_00926100 [Aphelenchoides besseyi]KAI6194191.1 hypothetical protein M3Y96_01098500 [Aphelenchoides besseyi]